MAANTKATINTDYLVIPKPKIEIQEEEDAWGILFNPETDHSFALNPVSVFIWKQIAHQYTINELVNQVRNNCSGVPDEVEEDVKEFIEQLLDKDMILLKKNED